LTLYVKGAHPPYCAPDLIRQEVDLARQLLGVDTLDVFILHRDDPAVSAVAWADLLLAELDRGSVRALGVSNWTLSRFDDLRGAMGSNSAALTVFSNHFSLAEMVTPTWPGSLAMTRDDISTLGASGTTVLAWAGLAGGYFAGRDIPSWQSSANAARRERAGSLARQLDTTPPAIALAYLLHQPQHVLAAVGTRSPAHLDELLPAAGIQLSAEQLAWLEHG
jgi:aryl-alcohol dehydrogenase-like predicted oxidoreductase